MTESVTARITCGRFSMGPPVQQFQVGNGITYLIHPDHRNGAATKSQWTIPELDERQVFESSLLSNWTDVLQGAGWGLHLVAGRPSNLGVTADRLLAVFVAKFVGGGGNQEWHGYPADPRRGGRDRPSVEVLGMWLRANVLTPAKISKIAKGRP